MKSVAIGKGSAAIALVLAGCSSGPAVEVGEKEDSGGASSTASEVWTGYLEGVVLKGTSSTTNSLVTSDQITVSFQTRSASGVTGTVVFGSGSPPPVDPTVAPPDYGTFTLVQGFPFPIREGTLSGPRAQFIVYWPDQDGPWCALQTPHVCDNALTAEVDYLYTCVPCGGCDASDAKCAMCGWCLCTENSCSIVVLDEPGYRIGFDLTFQGDAASGTAMGVNSTGTTAIPVNVRLTRVQ